MKFFWLIALAMFLYAVLYHIFYDSDFTNDEETDIEETFRRNRSWRRSPRNDDDDYEEDEGYL